MFGTRYTYKKWSKEEIDKFCLYWEAGLPLKVIAWKMNRGITSIWKKRVALGLAPRFRPKTVEAFKVLLTREQAQLVREKCRRKGIQMSKYMRDLIEDDLL